MPGTVSGILLVAVFAAVAAVAAVCALLAVRLPAASSPRNKPSPGSRPDRPDGR